MKKAKNPGNLRVAVIGGGMSGILCGIKLQEIGVTDFSIYEKAASLGGTWRDNTYPGLACDVPSHLYSYSFEPNSEWTRKFSPGPEIWEYFERIAEKYNVQSFVKFNKEVTESVFKDGKWHLETQDGDKDVVDVVICATGVLHHPNYPEIEGIDSFKGDIFHSARWDSTVSVAGKKVGIIGTGSTAIQMVPALIDEVEELSLFQRTAQWVFPQENPFYTDDDKNLFRQNPSVMEKMHSSMSKTFSESFSNAVVGANPEQLDLIQTTCQENLDRNVKNLELKEKLTPDYQAACKRLVMSDDFYGAIQKDNASLVADPIEKIQSEGILTKDGKLHSLDTIVLATGFNAHQFMRPMNIVGKNGINLDEYWGDTTPAYRSVSLPGFPNFFTLIGPNSPVGNFSLIEVAEIQLKYIFQLVELIRGSEYSEVSAKKSATDRFSKDLVEAMKGTVWVSGCKSWYLDKHGNPATWPWTFQRFLEDMEKPDLEDFDLCG